jgi:hypothetical protein
MVVICLENNRQERFMRPILLCAGLIIGLSACAPTAPYSNVLDTAGRGVGFSDYAQYMRAQEELSRIRRADAAQGRVMGAPAAVQPQQGATIGSQAVAALRGTAPAAGQPSVATPAPTQIASAQPVAPVGPATVTDQQFQPQPFGTPQQNQVITRDFVPQVRVSDTELGAGGPNLFNFALSSTHRVGEQRYTRRNLMRWQRWEAACAQFTNQDLAQEAFLAAGGPDRDPENLDPDGDGFACWWDPAPFRQAATTVRARQ